MIRDEIKKIIEKAVKKVGDVQAPHFSVEVPGEKSFGDYSTNVALALSKQLQQSPLEVANQIANHIKSDMFEKVEVKSPGFINFYLSKDFFVESIKKIDKNIGKNSSFKKAKTIVEYTDPNILKEFHIGHFMSNAIGESVSRIFEFQGANVKRVCYQGDVGLHVAKAVWGKLKNVDKSWQDAYVFGAEAYENDETAKGEIASLNKKIFERSNKNINTLYDQGRKESLAYFEKLYAVLGTHFDRLFFESETAEIGKKLVYENVGKVFEKGEKGAIIFKGENVGLHTRVFINAEGLPTYEAKDLALPELKYRYFKYDKSVIITANEQNAYFDVMLAALKQIKPPLAEKTKHIGHGMMRLPEGKMSSRTGKVVTAESLIGKVKEMVLEKANDKNLDGATVEQIAIGAIKCSILKQSIGSDIIYDFDRAISFEGDSGPYLQYSYARAISLLRKAKAEKVKASLKNAPPEITQLEKLMHQFSDVVEKAGKECEPHLVALYITELAREFNNYYAHTKVVDKTDMFSPYRVAVVEAFSLIMKNGLWLLGIKAPEKM